MVAFIFVLQKPKKGLPTLENHVMDEQSLFFEKGKENEKSKKTTSCKTTHFSVLCFQIQIFLALEVLFMAFEL